MVGGYGGLSFHHGGIFGVAHKLLEKGAIVNHGAAQVFSACLSLGLAKRDFVGGAIVLGDYRMVDGDVSGPLIEIAHGIATGGHDVPEELIGLGDGPSGSIYKVGLHAIPLLGVPGLIFRGERAKIELLDALGALLKLGLGATAIATFGNGAIVLWTKMLAKLLCASFFQKEHNRANNEQYNGDQNDNLDGSEILQVHNPVLLFLCV
jgi:hypothetical protein